MPPVQPNPGSPMSSARMKMIFGFSGAALATVAVRRSRARERNFTPANSGSGLIWDKQKLAGDFTEARRNLPKRRGWTSTKDTKETQKIERAANESNEWKRRGEALRA